MRIPATRPLAARRVIQALASDAKLRLLRLLVRGPVSPSAMAKELNMALSVVTEHLRDLERAGIVRTAGYSREGRGRPAKLYTLSSKRITLEIDLPLYASVGSEDEVLSLAIEYVRRKIEGPGLPASPSALDVAETLGLDVHVAAVVLDALREPKREVLDFLGDAIFRELKPDAWLDFDELAARLNVDKYWVLLSLRDMAGRGFVEVRGGRVRALP